MKPVLSIVPLNQSRGAPTVSNARLQAIKDVDQRARAAEGKHEPDRLGAQHVAIGAGGLLIVGFFVSVMIFALVKAVSA